MGIRADQAADAVQQLIRDDGLRKGEAIPSQRLLSEKLEISRTALREGISALVARGELRSEPGRGVFVSRDHGDTKRGAVNWTTADISPPDVYQLRYVIEPFVAGLVATRVTPHVIRRLEDNVNAIRSSLLEGAIETAAELDFQFHSLILESAGNPTLKEAVMTRMPSYRTSQTLPFAKDKDRLDTWREHRRIMLALKRHSSRSATRAMRDHILKAALRGGNKFAISSHD
mgnify:CR=1 FL=1